MTVFAMRLIAMHRAKTVFDVVAIPSRPRPPFVFCLINLL
jgi:hypothetical protein